MLRRGPDLPAVLLSPTLAQRLFAANMGIQPQAHLLLSAQEWTVPTVSAWIPQCREVSGISGSLLRHAALMQALKAVSTDMSYPAMCSMGTSPRLWA